MGWLELAFSVGVPSAVLATSAYFACRVRDRYRAAALAIATVAPIATLACFFTYAAVSAGRNAQVDWLELSINAPAAGAICGGLAGLGTVVIGSFIHRLRHRAGKEPACRLCGHRLAGGRGSRCPECGESIHHRRTRRLLLADLRASFLLLLAAAGVTYGAAWLQFLLAPYTPTGPLPVAAFLLLSTGSAVVYSLIAVARRRPILLPLGGAAALLLLLLWSYPRR